MAERYMYLPNCGLMAAIAWLFFQTPYPYVFAGALGAFYFTKLMYFMPAFKNQKDYVEHSLQDFPDQFALWNWKGILSREKNHLFSAMAAWAMGLRYREIDFRLNFNLAQLMASLGYLKEADKYYLKAGEGLIAEEQKKQAVEMLEKARTLLKKKIAAAEGQKRGRIIAP